jgi:hypothetical protein
MIRWWTRARVLSLAWLVMVATVLTACGGGGGSASNSGGSSGGGSGGGSGTAATLTGIVAAGAPMLGAAISVVDSAGNTVGADSASLADGSYTLTLTSTSPTLPLLVQASGVDMAGLPLLLYTVVPSVASGTGARTVAHINNLSTALTALLLGEQPSKHFVNASTRHGEWTVLANAAAQTAAQTWLKTVVKANLADGKLTNLANVDFLKDASFAANKTALDIALESIRLRFTTNLSGKVLMQISNRLIVPGVSEVSVDLAAARTALAASTPAITNAGVVTSTLVATTGNSSIMPNLASLDTLSAKLNAAIAAHSSVNEIAALGVFNSAFTFQDSLDGLGVANTLVGWGLSGYQISRWQVLGCLDTTLPTKGCGQIRAAALVRDGAGNVQGIFNTVVNYATATGWTLLGNGRQTPWAIYPVTWAEWTSAGVIDSSAASNPGQGVQVVIGSTAFMGATLQLPNGYSLPFYYCNTTAMCATTDGTSGVLTGNLLTDQVLKSTMAGWVGNSDAVPGARYGLKTITLVAGSEDNSTVLTTDMPSNTDPKAYPLPDGLSSAAPLSINDFTAGLTLSWATWAAANPDKRIVEVRAVITSTATAPVIQTVTVQPLAARSLTLAAFGTIPSDAVAYTLWLVAQDDQGRRYISKVSAS